MSVGRASSSPWMLVLPVAAVAISAGAAFLVGRTWRDRYRQLQSKVSELEASLDYSFQQRSAERKGRIRAQQELRKALVLKDQPYVDGPVYPMTPIGTIQSCFSTRNGTPRQPFLVPISRACLTLMPGGVPETALDGLAEFSHCWLLYVFHANTDLFHLWKQPSHRDFKAKVRVPRLNGGKLGVYATRSPHRPCPIGLSVAKLEGIYGRMLLLSGVDLVDGTPVLDVKPYLPYCDSVQDAHVPSWVGASNVDDPLALVSVEFSKDFVKDLLTCWEVKGKQSLYSGLEEFQKLVEEVLIRDIRSLRQRHKPYGSSLSLADEDTDLDGEGATCLEGHDEADGEDGSKLTKSVYADPRSDLGKALSCLGKSEMTLSNGNPDVVVYHLILEGINIAYTVNDGQVVVQGAEVSSPTNVSGAHECNHGIWAKVVNS